MDDYRNILKSEFDADDDSFSINLRIQLYWDKKAFARLTNAMKTCCEQEEKSESMERWLAEGFWYFSWFVKDWSQHENFPRPETEEYYEAAYERLDDLAYWFFVGESPYSNGQGFEPL